MNLLAQLVPQDNINQALAKEDVLAVLQEHIALPSGPRAQALAPLAAMACTNLAQAKQVVVIASQGSSATTAHLPTTMPATVAMEDARLDPRDVGLVLQAGTVMEGGMAATLVP